MDVANLPGINTLLDVLVGEEDVYQSRLEDADGSVLTIAALLGVRGGQPAPGDRLGLAWVAGEHRYRVPVRLTAIVPEHPPRWLVEVTGETRRHNRRSFVRSLSGAPVLVSQVAEGRLEAPVAGVISDIGERSARCRLPMGPYSPGDVLQARLAVGDEFVDTAAELVAVRKSDDLGVEVVLAYELPEHDAAIIRRHVLEQQRAVRQRRHLSG